MTTATQEAIITNGFLPADYVMPSKSKMYLKLKGGNNKIRILAAPILGWVVFDKDNKPHRASLNDGFEALDQIEVKVDEGKPTTPRHFWCLIVWDYQSNDIKILELTQKSIITDIIDLDKNEDWGNPLNYDLTIVRKGTGKMDTQYSVTPSAPKAIPEEAIKALDHYDIDLELMFNGEYPIKNYL